VLGRSDEEPRRGRLEIEQQAAFRVAAASARLIDLTLPPFAHAAALWQAPVDYRACQGLADAARAGRIEAIRYGSVRDPQRRANVALLSPQAFAATGPEATETWGSSCAPTR